MSKITRGISKEFADLFVKTELFELYNNYREELFLAVRNNYLNIYYKGKSISKVEIARGNLKYKIAKKYLGVEKDEYFSIEPARIVTEYEKIKNRIDQKYIIREKEAQQKLILNNNANSKSKWFCLDVEYTKQRNNSGEDQYGRFDIIAVSKVKPFQVALIELKYGEKAIGGNSGVIKHADDYIKFLQEKEFENHLLFALVDIIESYRYLSIDTPFAGTLKEDFIQKPVIYFITLDNTNDKARQCMQRYVLEGKESSKYNIEREMKINITKENEKGFTPHFLFSDDDGANIHDIIEDNLYNKRTLV